MTNFDTTTLIGIVGVAAVILVSIGLGIWVWTTVGKASK